MIKEIDEMLLQWARWRASSGSNVSPYAWARLIKDSDVWTQDRKATIPIMALECANIEKCVMALDPVLRKAVEEQYRFTSLPEEKAQRCGCGRMTFYRRIDRAHIRIQEMLQTQAETGIEPAAWAELSTRPTESRVDR